MTPEQLRKKIEMRESPETEALVKKLLAALEEGWDGERSVTVHLDSVGRIAERAAGKLRALGWRVEMAAYSDQRDGSGVKFTIGEAPRPSYDPRD